MERYFLPRLKRKMRMKRRNGTDKRRFAFFDIVMYIRYNFRLWLLPLSRSRAMFSFLSPMFAGTGAAIAASGATWDTLRQNFSHPPK
jgi:hypothetical protein